MQTTIDPSARERITERQEELTKTRSAEAERLAIHDTAQAKLRTLQHQLASGTEVEALDYALANAANEIASALAKAASKAREQAERDARRSDLDVAQAIADALGDVYTCGATITDRLPDTYDKKKLPHLYVIQSQVTNHLGRGVIGGSARLALAATDRMIAGPATAEVSRKLERRGFKVGITTKAPTETVGGVWLTEHLVTLTEGWANYPKLVERFDKPVGRPVSLALGDMIHQAVNTYELHKGAGPAPRMEVGWMLGPVGPVTELDDERCTREIVLGIALDPPYNIPAQWDSARSMGRAAVAQLVGGLIPGVGTVLEAVPGAKPFDLDKPGAHTFATLKVGYRPDGEV